KGIEPDIVVIQDVPDELKGKDKSRGEAALRGHLEAEGQDENAGEEKEVSASSAYVPPDPKDDTQLNYAYDLLRGIQVNNAFPPNPNPAVPN
ncbi:MAG: peptidase S41, partial [Hyphomicrobiales bacterium]|nr:peptidase S41 [Hyphomicrobiales bacterium]